VLVAVEQPRVERTHPIEPGIGRTLEGFRRGDGMDARLHPPEHGTECPHPPRLPLDRREQRLARTPCEQHRRALIPHAFNANIGHGEAARDGGADRLGFALHPPELVGLEDAQRRDVAAMLDAPDHCVLPAVHRYRRGRVRHAERGEHGEGIEHLLICHAKSFRNSHANCTRNILAVFHRFYGVEIPQSWHILRASMSEISECLATDDVF